MTRNRARTERRPPTLSIAAALIAAVGSALLTAVSVHSLAAGVVGVVSLAVGLRRGSPSAFTVGAVALFAGVLVAGVLGASPELLLLAAFLTVIAWETGRNGFGIAAEVGRDAPTLRVETLHLVSRIVVLTVGMSVGYAVFRGVTGGRSVLAVVALLVGAVALLVSVQGEGSRSRT